MLHRIKSFWQGLCNNQPRQDKASADLAMNVETLKESVVRLFNNELNDRIPLQVETKVLQSPVYHPQTNDIDLYLALIQRLSPIYATEQTCDDFCYCNVAPCPPVFGIYWRNYKCICRDLCVIDASSPNMVMIFFIPVHPSSDMSDIPHYLTKAFLSCDRVLGVGIHVSDKRRCNLLALAEYIHQKQEHHVLDARIITHMANVMLYCHDVHGTAITDL